MSCNHGPNEMCIKCMGKTDPGHLTKGKCNHGPGGVCAYCINKKGTTETKKKKESSIQKAKEEAEREELYKRTISKCTHGPHERCIHCIGLSTKDKDAQNNESGTMISVKGDAPVLVPPPKRIQTAAAAAGNTTSTEETTCNHDDSIVCIHCKDRKCGRTFEANTVTVDADTGNYAFINECDPDTVRITCPNHGPRGVCTYCMRIKGTYRVRIDQGQTGPKWINKICIDPKITGNFLRYISIHMKDDPRKEKFRWFSWIYGTYNVARRTVTMEACFEPPQNWDRTVEGSIPIVDPKSDPAAEQVASAMGLRRVGFIIRRRVIKSKKSDNEGADVLLTAPELVFLARMQLRFGPQFCCVLFDHTETPHIYQASDAAVLLARKRILSAKCKDVETVSLLKPAMIGPTEVMESDPVRMTIPVPFAIRKEKAGVFPLNSFPLLNRPEFPVSNANIKEQIKFAESKKLHPLADFGFLVYLAKNRILSPVNDIPAICNCIQAFKNTADLKESLEGFMLILSEF